MKGLGWWLFGGGLVLAGYLYYRARQEAPALPERTPESGEVEAKEPEIVGKVPDDE